MSNGKVLSLYMTVPDLMRPGHRMTCDEIECDPNGIIGDINYDKPKEHVILLVSKKSYDIIDEAEIVVDKGILMENIYVDIDLNHLKKGSIIEIGDTVMEVTGSCHAYDYLYAFAPEIPDMIRGNRGIFVTPVEHGAIEVGQEVRIIEEA